MSSKKDISGISVCIPARNESKTIGQTVYSILNGYRGPDLEVIVCANGCSDNTEEVVHQIRANDSRVKLIASKPGKPNAWNACVNSATYDDLVFADGDVIIKQGSVVNIVNHLHEQDLVAVASKQHKIVHNFAQKILHYPYVIPGIYLCGRLYAMDRVQGLDMLREKGYSEMPADIINEDLWLSVVFEQRDANKKIIEKKWGYCKDAEVYFHVPSIRDEFTQLKRITRGNAQIEQDYPELNFTSSSRFSLSIMAERVFGYLRELETIPEKIITPAIFPAQGIIHGGMWFYCLAKAYLNYKKEPAANLWAVSTTTKTTYSAALLNQIVTTSVPGPEK